MSLLEIAKRSIAAYSDDNIPRLASSVAFAAVFSIAPLLIVLIAVLGAIVGGHQAAQDSLLTGIRSSMGIEAANTFRDIIASSFNKPREGITAQIIGWGSFILGASNLFSSLQDALNTIWNVEHVQSGWKHLLRDRLAAGCMIIIFACILLVTFLANTAITIFNTTHQASLASTHMPLFIASISQICTFFVMMLVFSLTLKILPDASIGWRAAWQGGLITAILFTIGQNAIGFYLTKGGLASAYGAAGSLLVALLWIYYSVITLLIGAEITKITTMHNASQPQADQSPTLQQHYT